MTLNRTDHDNDSVLTIFEDLNGDHNFDNDDTDSQMVFQTIWIQMMMGMKY